MNIERAEGKRLGRNKPCPCGSNRKYKHCHLPFVNGKKQEEIQKRNRRDEAARIYTQMISPRGNANGTNTGG